MTIPLIFLGLLALAYALSAPWTPKTTHGVRNEQLRRRHREINRLHLGEDGFTLPHPLYCIAVLLWAHVVVSALHFIVMTVMGMQEPKW